MNRAEMESAVHATYQTRLSNDAVQTAALFTPTARFLMVGSEPAATAPQVATAAQIGEAMQTVIGLWQWLDYQPLSTLIDGNRVAAHYRVSMRFVPTGDVVDTELFDLMTFENGKLTELVEFYDTALARRFIAMTAADSQPDRSAPAG
jgi:ketosteroid isomerase-like protein